MTQQRPSTTTPLTPERAYAMGYNHGLAAMVPPRNIRALRRAPCLLACYRQGYEAGAEVREGGMRA
jgi:hypothetical protein